MNNIPHPVPSVNSPHDPDLNRFGLNPHSLIGYAGGSKMGGIEPTSIIEIVSNPDVHGVEHGEWKMMKCGCPFSVDGSAPKGKGIAYKCSANGWFTFRCFDDSHGHPGSKYGTDNTGRGFYSYVIPVPNTNHVDVGHKLVAIEFNAADSDVAKALFGWTKESKISSTLMAANHKTKDNYVIFRADRLAGFKYESLVEAIPGTRINRDFKCDRRLTYRHNGIEIAVSDFSASDIPIAKPSAWSKLFVKAGLSECLTIIDPEPAPGAAAPKEHASVQEVKIDPVREVRLNFDKRIEKGAEAEAKKNFRLNDKYAHLLEGYEGFECDPDDRRPIEDQVARAVHEAMERVWNVRCWKAPELVTTYSKGGVGFAHYSTLTCWQASCRECRPFVIGSMASAVEVQLAVWKVAGYSVSAFVVDLGSLTDKKIIQSLKNWTRNPSNYTSGLITHNETRGVVSAHTPLLNRWIAVRTAEFMVYMFAHHFDMGEGQFIPTCCRAKDQRFVPVDYTSLFHGATSIPASVDRLFKEVEAMDGEQICGDILFGDRESVKFINKLRRAITGRGSSVVPKEQRAEAKAEKAKRRAAEGIEEYQVTAGTRLRIGVMEILSAKTETTITPENPTADGLFPGNTSNRLQMNLSTTDAVNEAVRTGRSKRATPGRKRGGSKKHKRMIADIDAQISGDSQQSAVKPFSPK